MNFCAETNELEHRLLCTFRIIIIMYFEYELIVIAIKITLSVCFVELECDEF